MASKPNPFNTAINFLVLGVLLYVVFTGYFSPAHKKEQQVNNEAKPVTVEEESGASEFNQFSDIFNMMASSVQTTLNVISETPGTGSVLACGQNVTYRYSDKVIGSAEAFIKNKEKSFRIGTDSVLEGHMRALYEMKVGGKKQVQFSAKWGYLSDGPKEAQGKDIESSIELLSATPAAPNPKMPFRIFYKKPHVLVKPAFECGMTVQAKFRIWALDGRQLYPADDKKPEWVKLTIGDGRVPFGIETVLMRMSENEYTTAILPHELVMFFNSKSENEKPLTDTDKALRDLEFPKNQAIMVDIEDVKAIEATPDGANENKEENNSQAPAAVEQNNDKPAQ